MRSAIDKQRAASHGDGRYFRQHVNEKLSLHEIFYTAIREKRGSRGHRKFKFELKIMSASFRTRQRSCFRFGVFRQIPVRYGDPSEIRQYPSPFLSVQFQVTRDPVDFLRPVRPDSDSGESGNPMELGVPRILNHEHGNPGVQCFLVNAEQFLF